jgi:probable rRNA maturation factor
VWEGQRALPFVLETEVLLLAHQPDDVRERALALFAGKARRAIGLDAETVILITTSAELRELNRRYRHKDKATDVLSFETTTSRGMSVGELAISAEIAAANAAALGLSTETELRILILHGLLHLAGYDHETDKGEMRARELKLRMQLKLPVGLIERAHAIAPKGKATGADVALRKGRRR